MYIKIGKYRKIVIFFNKLLIILLITCVLGDTYIKIKNMDYKKIYNSNTQISSKALVISEAKESQYSKMYNIKMIGEKENKKFIIKLNKKINQDINYGDLIYLEGEYEAPSTARNFKGFDYSNYLKSKGIYGTINIKKINIVEKSKINIISKTINNIRNSIINNSNKLIVDNNIAALMIGVLIGDTSYIDEETVEDFKNSSLTHMLAVSGQHVGYIVLAISFALNVSKMGKRKGKIISIFIIILFMMITGITPSVFRAGVMGICIIIASLLHRKSDIYINLGLAMILMLSFNPFAIYDIGLQLSYRRSTRDCIIS